MIGIIYQIAFKETNKSYIGQTIKDPLRRLKEHINESERNSQKAIHRAIRKYGKNNIVFNILCEVTLFSFIENKKCILDILEEYYIQKIDTFGKNGYNMTRGGEGSLGRILTEKTKQLIRNKAIGRKISQKTKDKLSASLTKYYQLHSYSQEAKQKLSIANKGNVSVYDKNVNIIVIKNTDERYINKKLNHILFGRKLNKKRCQQLSKIHKNKVFVKIDEKLKKIDRNDPRILSGELKITSNVAGKNIHSDIEKEKRRIKFKADNPNYKTIEIYDNNDNLIFNSYKNFSNFLKEHNLPNTFLFSYKNNGRKLGSTPQTKAKLIKKGFEKYIGWYSKIK